MISESSTPGKWNWKRQAIVFSRGRGWPAHEEHSPTFQRGYNAPGELQLCRLKSHEAPNSKTNFSRRKHL